MDATGDAAMPRKQGFLGWLSGYAKTYEFRLLIVLTLGNGIVGFDRQTVAFLAPYIVDDLGLNNTQVGWTASALSLAIALSSFFGSQLADRTGKRKLVLVICTLLFSLLSGVSGLATSFMILLAARFALGASEGPIVPISQTLILDTSSPERRGVNMGFMQMVGAFGIAGFIGPIVATQLASAYNWRIAMFLSVLPGLAVALAMLLLMRRDPEGRPAHVEHHGSPFAAFGTLLKNSNMRASLAIAGLITAWLVLQSTYLALFLTKVKGLEPTTAGWVIGMGGWAGLVGGIGLPLLSDRFGRKPVMALGALGGTLGPLALLLLPGDPRLLAIAVLIGWLPLGIAPLYCATVPTESVSPALATTAVGLSMGTAELLGGVVAPFIVGPVADRFGLESVFLTCIGLALAAFLVALFLKETAPCKVGAAVES